MTASNESHLLEPTAEDHWKWRYAMIEQVAATLDPTHFSLQAFYIIGSTKQAKAGPGSDIDIIIHIKQGAQTESLSDWFNEWSGFLDELNWFRTGIRTHRFLDVHYITDQDIEEQTSWASKINAISDPARELSMGSACER